MAWTAQGSCRRLQGSVLQQQLAANRCCITRPAEHAALFAFSMLGDGRAAKGGCRWLEAAFTMRQRWEGRQLQALGLVLLAR